MGRLRLAGRNVFVLLFQGRVGSTYLIEGLDSHPQVNAVGEKFKKPGGSATAQLTAMRRFLEQAPSTGRTAHGFKIKFRDVIDPDGLAFLLRDLEASILVLDRRNHIKHLVSHYTAVKLHESTGAWNRYESGEKSHKIRIEVDEFSTALDRLERRRNALRNFVTSLELPTLLLQYEYILLSETTVFETVLHFLGLQPIAVEGHARKNTNDDLRKVLTNYHELVSHYRGTRYESMFQEILTPSG